jgi:hypothetical protein
MAVIVTVHGTFAGENKDKTGGRKKSRRPKSKTSAAQQPEPAIVESSSGASAPTKIPWNEANSDFANRVRELVNGVDGTLQWDKFTWSGENSEASRRQHARGLLSKLFSLEQQKSPYVVIGHSHGGSVLAFALQLAAKSGSSLPNMRAWITVGTPFLHHKKKTFLYARGDGLTKGAILIAFTIIISSAIRNLSVDGPPKDIASAAGWAAVVLALFLGALYAIKKFVEKEPDYELLDKPQLEKVRTTFEARRVSYYHPNDEAIQGLTGLKSNQLDLFPSDFATDFLIAPLIPLLLPFALILAVFTGIDEPVGRLLLSLAPKDTTLGSSRIRSPNELLNPPILPPNFFNPPPSASVQDLAKKLAPPATLPRSTQLPPVFNIPSFGDPASDKKKIDELARQQLKESEGKIQEELERDRNKPSPALIDPGRWYSTDAEISSMRVRPEMSVLEAAEVRVQRAAMIVLAAPVLCFRVLNYFTPSTAWQKFYLVAVAVVGTLSVAYVSIAWISARLLSIVVSRNLSRTTREQVKTLAFGTDVPAETVSTCEPAPIWQSDETGLLKDDVSAEITDLSDKAAAEAIGKFRGLISEILSGHDLDAVKSKVAEIINWQELVHTTYFSSKRFTLTLCERLVFTSAFTWRSQADLRDDE